MEEMLKAARDAGFTTWGFSPHAPIFIESPCNMRSEDVEAYFQEIERLRNLFPEIKLLAGMEVDYLDEKHGPHSPEVNKYGLDYVIGSIHFIPNQRGDFYDVDGSPERFRKYLHDYFEDDLKYVVRTFWEQTQRMIEAGKLDIIGHIDKIALNASFINSNIEDDPEYRKLADETIRMAIERGLKIEINTKHLEKYGRLFPHPRYWKFILDSGIEMPVNTDAHYADKIESGMEYTQKLKDSISEKTYSPDRK